jgi:ABC-type lipoprotein release transport system permease subunit
MSFTTLRIAWRNLWRNRTRTLIALGAITLAQLFVISMGSLMAGSFQDMFDTLTGPFVGHVKVETRDWRRELDKAERAYADAREDATLDAKATAALEAALLEARGNRQMFDEYIDEAAESYARSLGIYLRIEDRAGAGRVYTRLGRIAVRRDQAEESRRLFSLARSEFAAAGDLAASAVASSFIENSSPIAKAMPEHIDDVSLVRKRLRALDGVTDVSPRVMTSVLAFKADDTGAPADAHPALVVGLHLDVETSAGGLLDDLHKDQLPRQGAVALGQGLARRLGVSAGDKVAVIGQRIDESPVDGLFAIATVMRSELESVNDRGIVMGFGDATDLIAAGDSAHEIIIRGSNHEAAGDLADRVRAMPELADALVQPWYEASPDIAQMLDMKGAIDFIFILVLLVAAAAGIANTMMMSTFERTREFGMLLGVGCSPGRVISMVLVESIVLGVMGVAIGSALGATLVAITSHTGINYAALTGVGDKGTDIAFAGLNFSFIIYPKLDWSYVTNGMIVVALTSLVASLLPALSASRLEPMEALQS